MSGIAMAEGGDFCGGLVPRYLRSSETSGRGRAPGDEAAQEAKRQVFSTEPARPMTELGVVSATEQMRQRIAQAAGPQQHRARPIWLGLAAVVVAAAAITMFPDTVLAFLPDVSPSL